MELLNEIKRIKKLMSINEQPVPVSTLSSIMKNAWTGLQSIGVKGFDNTLDEAARIGLGSFLSGKNLTRGNLYQRLSSLFSNPTLYNNLTMEEVTQLLKYLSVNKSFRSGVVDAIKSDGYVIFEIESMLSNGFSKVAIKNQLATTLGDDIAEEIVEKATVKINPTVISAVPNLDAGYTLTVKALDDFASEIGNPKFKSKMDQMFTKENMVKIFTKADEMVSKGTPPDAKWFKSELESLAAQYPTAWERVEKNAIVKALKNIYFGKENKLHTARTVARMYFTLAALLSFYVGDVTHSDRWTRCMEGKGYDEDNGQITFNGKEVDVNSIEYRNVVDSCSREARSETIINYFKRLSSFYGLSLLGGSFTPDWTYTGKKEVKDVKDDETVTDYTTEFKAFMKKKLGDNYVESKVVADVKNGLYNYDGTVYETKDKGKTFVE